MIRRGHGGEIYKHGSYRVFQTVGQANAHLSSLPETVAREMKIGGKHIEKPLISGQTLVCSHQELTGIPAVALP